MKTDVVIVGAGPAGIFTALEMIKLGSKNKIIIVCFNYCRKFI